MAGRIPQNFIDDLLTRLDIIDVVGNRTKLKKAGKNYSACCPFHQEKTPSFTVSPDKQFYYCFGCGATGSAIKFVMEFDGLEFPDAVDKLAQEQGIDVPREHSNQPSRESLHRPLYQRAQEASDFFEQQLRDSTHKQKAVNYLKERGLSGKAAKFFSIGFAPPGWDNLQTHLLSQATQKKERDEALKQLISCGMTIEKEDGRTYDRFRDRVMFPIRNAKGQVIAFGGRVLGDEKPKYLNSPETPIFHKNQELYGLFEARKIRQKLTRMIIVEGYMDVVALAEFGIHYAVATLGTATSEHHIRRLFKVVPEIIFCFDGDNAGRTAAHRAMETVIPALQDGLQARFLFLPDGEDPDTMVRQEGKEAFEKRLDGAKHLPEFLFDHIKQQVDFDTLDGKARFGQLAAPLIARLPKGMLKKLMNQQLSQETGISETDLADILPTQAPPPVERQSPRIHQTDSQASASQPSDSLDHDSPHDVQYQPDSEPHDHTDYGFADDHGGTTTSDGDHKKDRLLQALTLKALTYLVKYPACAEKIQDITEIEAEDEYQRLLIEICKKLQQSPQSSSIGLLIQWTGSPYEQQLKALANDALNLPANADPAAEINGVVQRLLHRNLRREWLQLKREVESRSLKALSPEQKQRYLELPKLLKTHKK